MTHPVPDDVQERMLFAVDTFDECHKTMPDGSPRNYEEATTEFWKAFAEWAPRAVVGVIDIETEINGKVTVKYEPYQ